ncbi:cysteine hydrolase family protein [Thalassobacillus hwangdonensis]|uniref:Cysteine hydrolase family protein n=1 Tax=Thalassobacillus hwangdonensis TaxID=546108 RepID=A0ABW3L6M5_9BACI
MKNTALILVDIQKAFEDKRWGKRNNPDAEEKMRTVLDFFRDRNGEVIHIQHMSEDPSSVFYHKGKGFEPKDIVAPLSGEKVITKTVNSAFIGTDLHEYLQSKSIQIVVIVGLTTPHCVSTTTRMSGNLGYETYLVQDAVAAYELKDLEGNNLDPQVIHDLSLATLHDEFATVLDSDQLIDLFS